MPAKAKIRKVKVPKSTATAPAPVGSISGIKVPKPAPGPYVPAYGPKQAALFVLGERPGETEYREGRPFIGDSGRVLAQWFERAGLDLDSARMWNVVNDYKHGNPEPAAWEVERDRAVVLQEIVDCQPTVIAAVGAHAVRWLLGSSHDMDTVNGVPIEWTPAYSRFADPSDWDPVPIVVPVYHPANSFYKVELAANGQANVATVARVLRGQQKPRQDKFPDPSYYDIGGTRRVELGYCDAQGYPAIPDTAAGLVLAIDTEGSFRLPWCLSFASIAGAAAVLRTNAPAMARFREVLAEFIAIGGKVLLHHSMHDLSVLRGLGIDLPPGSFIDTMVMAYLLCLEPQGLKALAWRHAGMSMSSYDELVDPANKQHALQYLLQANSTQPPGGWPDSEPYLIMERVDKKFVPKVKKPWPVQRYLEGIFKDWASEKKNSKGEMVDIRARWHHIDPEIRKPVEDYFGPMPVATLDDVPLDQAIDYAARDADATLRIYPVLDAMIGQMDQRGILAIDLGAIPMFERMQANGFAVDRGHFARLGQRMLTEMERIRYQITELTGAEINPNSPDQVGELLFDQLGLKYTKLTKGGKSGKNKKPSTNDKVLEAMRFVHPVMPLILDYRECSKTKSSFCDPALALASSDQRLRGTIKVTRVASGRPSMADPNLLAQPVRSDLGKELRRGFIAAPGCVLGDWDLTQIEMCEMAHQSQDPVLLALLNDPEKDAHSETAALMFGLKLYSGNKRERYADIDEMRHRYAAKRVGFGVITGITGMGLEAQMAVANATKNGLPLGQGGDPWTEDDCDGLITEWFKIYKGVKRFMLACRAEVRQNGYARDRWGRIRYLPGIYSDRSWIREEAERQSHSHKISSSAAGVMKQAMAQIWLHVLDMWNEPGITHTVGDAVYPGRHVEPILQIYDSLVFEVEDDPALKEYWNQVMTNCLCYTTTMSVPIKAKGSWSHRWGGD